MNIHGWEKIIPQLATYFAVLKHRKDRLTPFNLFVSGLPGTNKTQGCLELAEHQNLSVGLIDASTLDDVAELAGVVNLKANREDGKAEVIVGGLLNGKQVLILDELPNARPHVMPQFRLLLQRHLVLLGKPFDMDVEAIIATGNLTEDMQQGEANMLDSPTADRFVMVVTVPSMSTMNTEDVMNILSKEPGLKFAAAFDKAMAGVDKYYDEIDVTKKIRVVTYVRTLVRELAKTAFAFEGRRAQLLLEFVIAALALCKSDSTLDEKETVWQVARDVLSYHKLSGLELDMAVLLSKHEEAFHLAFSDSALEALISGEPDLSVKISLMVASLSAVSPVTKADLLRLVVESDDISLKLAAIDLVNLPVFAEEPAALKELIAKLDLSAGAVPVKVKAEHLLALSKMSQAEALAFGLAGANQKKKVELMAQVDKHLNRWGVRKPAA